MCHNGEMSRYIKNRKKPFSEDEGKIFFFFYVALTALTFWLTQYLILVKEYLKLPSLNLL